MSYHPAYPSTADLLRERDATNRDLADRLRVSVLDSILRRAVREIEAVSEIEHPDARYSVGELAGQHPTARMAGRQGSPQAVFSTRQAASSGRRECTQTVYYLIIGP